MNALDSLFDFATLMSTSSAMTLASDTNDCPETLSRTSQISSAIAQRTQIPCGHGNQFQQHVHTQPEACAPSNIVHKQSFVDVSRAGTHQIGQSDLDWFPAPQQLRNPCVQYQFLDRPEGQHLTQVTGPDREVDFSHCTSLPMGYLQQPAAPQYLQHMPDQQMPGNHVCHDQPCIPLGNHQFFPPLGHDFIGGSIPASHQQIAGDGINIAFQNYNNSSAYRAGPLRQH